MEHDSCRLKDSTPASGDGGDCVAGSEQKGKTPVNHAQSGLPPFGSVDGDAILSGVGRVDRRLMVATLLLECVSTSVLGFTLCWQQTHILPNMCDYLF